MRVKKFLKVENKRIIYILMTLVWVGIIFSFSLQPAEVSDQTSRGVWDWIMETFLAETSEELQVMLTRQFDFLHFLLRKFGHFSEFFILGILSMLTLQQTKFHHKGIIGIVFCVLVASVDETIQLFVSGRSGQISDVVLDSVGAIVGVTFLLTVRKIKKNLIKKDKVQE